ncbi:hypothetical protein LEN26_011897 [Aphanomyces euteiches]|nr:hypothetical protein LEN26_011897 [Aphanomyces euteiches]
MSGAGKGKGKGKAKIQTQDKGKGKAKVPLEGNESKKTLGMNILAIRQRNARDAAKQLNMTTAQMIKVMEKQVELLENDLMRRKQEVDPHFLATVLATAEILDFQETTKELKSMLENREKLMKWLAAWVETYKVHKQDDYGRRRGSVYMTNRAHMMSQNAYPYKPFGCRIEDDTKVTAHLGEDANGVCVQAFECHVIFTVEANYENVAKTWRFDQTESTPIFSVKSVEDMDYDILYMIHEHNELKRKRIAISGIFCGYEGQDRITITHTGIAVDERYPFTPGEVRSNGFQWVIFEHVTDRLTIVRWSLLNYCPVNVNGSLSLLETAQSLRCPVSQYDSEEAIIKRMCRVSEQGLMKIRDQFRGRCKWFLLEPFTMGSRDKFSDENH